jgi:hypothetical protein
MWIICKDGTENKEYPTNNPINLDKCISFKKSSGEIEIDGNKIITYTIEFITANDVFIWTFDDEEIRDSKYERVERHLNY